MKNARIDILLMALVLPLIIGLTSSALSASGMQAYATMAKPPLSPPAWLFSVVWTLLYLMMGLASYWVIVDISAHGGKVEALVLYAIQLVMNFFWTILFFNFKQYWLAFIWLFAMWCLVIACTFWFFKVSKRAALLMVPYCLWLTFAAYLNLASAMLNVE